MLSILGDTVRIRLLHGLIEADNILLTVEAISELTGIKVNSVKKNLKDFESLGLLIVEDDKYKINLEDRRVLALIYLNMLEFLINAEDGFQEDHPRILDPPELKDLELRLENIKDTVKGGD